MTGLLQAFDQTRRQTFMALWEAGAVVRGVFAIAPLLADHGFPEDVLAPLRTRLLPESMMIPAGLGGVIPLDFDPSWPMDLVGDEQGLAVDFMFGTRRCRCRLPWRSLFRLEVVEVGAIHFESEGMDALVPPPAQEKPVVGRERDGNVTRVQFGKPGPRAVR